MRYRRVIVPGACYFFTVNLRDRKSSLLTEHIDKLRFAFQKTIQHYPFFIEAVVVLPDHLHLIMRLPEGDGNYSLRWNCIKGVFSKQIPADENGASFRKTKRAREIWQKRFWEHLIRDETDFEHHVNYIHNNPVKHGYAVNPSDWSYSSIHRFIKQGILSKHWGYNSGFGLLNFGERYELP